MRKLIIAFTVALAVLIPTLVLAAPQFKRSEAERHLNDVRKATAKYQDVNVALADGYVPAPVCAEAPGLGAMGYHYVNPVLAQDLELDPARPEILLYIKDKRGELKLAGVEYFQAAVGQPTPMFYDKAFDGPMEGHEPGMPTHYDLHLWLFERNPDGVFAAWNPALSCAE